MKKSILFLFVLTVFALIVQAGYVNYDDPQLVIHSISINRNATNWGSEDVCVSISFRNDSDAVSDTMTVTSLPELQILDSSQNVVSSTLIESTATVSQSLPFTLGSGESATCSFALSLNPYPANIIDTYIVSMNAQISYDCYINGVFDRSDTASSENSVNLQVYPFSDPASGSQSQTPPQDELPNVTVLSGNYYSDYHLMSGKTYYVDNYARFYQTLYVHGGAVVKLGNRNSALASTSGKIYLSGADARVVSITGPLNSAVFTSVHDNRSGEAISALITPGDYSNVDNLPREYDYYAALYFTGDQNNQSNIEYCRFGYGMYGIYLSSSSAAKTIKNSVFKGFSDYCIFASNFSCNLTIHNNLFEMNYRAHWGKSGIRMNYMGSSSDFTISNNTFRCPGRSQLFFGYSSTWNGNRKIKDNIFFDADIGSGNGVGIQFLGCSHNQMNLDEAYLDELISFNGYVETQYRIYNEDHYETIDSSRILTTLPFESGPSGDYYLQSDSTLIDAGSCTAKMALLDGQTSQKPSVSYSGTKLTKQVARDTGVVDLGYHYPAVDYVLTGISANADITIEKGVTIALDMEDTQYTGISMGQNAILSEGTFAGPVTFTPLNAVSDSIVSPFSGDGSEMLNFGTYSSMMLMRGISFENLNAIVQISISESITSPYFKMKDLFFFNTDLNLSAVNERLEIVNSLFLNSRIKGFADKCYFTGNTMSGKPVLTFECEKIVFQAAIDDTLSVMENSNIFYNIHEGEAVYSNSLNLNEYAYAFDVYPFDEGATETETQSFIARINHKGLKYGYYLKQEEPEGLAENKKWLDQREFDYNSLGTTALQGPNHACSPRDYYAESDTYVDFTYEQVLDDDGETVIDIITKMDYGFHYPYPYSLDFQVQLNDGEEKTSDRNMRIQLQHDVNENQLPWYDPEGIPVLFCGGVNPDFGAVTEPLIAKLANEYTLTATDIASSLNEKEQELSVQLGFAVGKFFIPITDVSSDSILYEVPLINHDIITQSNEYWSDYFEDIEMDGPFLYPLKVLVDQSSIPETMYIYCVYGIFKYHHGGKPELIAGGNMYKGAPSFGDNIVMEDVEYLSVDHRNEDLGYTEYQGHYCLWDELELMEDSEIINLHNKSPFLSTADWLDGYKLFYQAEKSWYDVPCFAMLNQSLFFEYDGLIFELQQSSGEGYEYRVVCGNEDENHLYFGDIFNHENEDGSIYVCPELINPVKRLYSASLKMHVKSMTQCEDGIYMLDERPEGSRYLQVVWKLRKVCSDDNLVDYHYPFVLELIVGGGAQEILIAETENDDLYPDPNNPDAFQHDDDDSYNPWLTGGYNSEDEWIEGHLMPKPEDEAHEGVPARGSYKLSQDGTYIWDNSGAMDITMRSTHTTGYKPAKYMLEYNAPYLYLLNTGKALCWQPYSLVNISKFYEGTRGWHLKMKVPEDTSEPGKLTYFTSMTVCNASNNPNGYPLVREQYPDELYSHDHGAIYINTIQGAAFYEDQMYMLLGTDEHYKLGSVEYPNKYRSIIRTESAFPYSGRKNLPSLTFFKDQMLVCDPYVNRIVHRKKVPVESKLMDESVNLKNNQNWIWRDAGGNDTEPLLENVRGILENAYDADASRYLWTTPKNETEGTVLALQSKALYRARYKVGFQADLPSSDDWLKLGLIAPNQGQEATLCISGYNDSSFFPANYRNQWVECYFESPVQSKAFVSNESKVLQFAFESAPPQVDEAYELLDVELKQLNVADYSADACIKSYCFTGSNTGAENGLTSDGNIFCLDTSEGLKIEPCNALNFELCFSESAGRFEVKPDTLYNAVFDLSMTSWPQGDPELNFYVKQVINDTSNTNTTPFMQCLQYQTPDENIEHGGLVLDQDTKQLRLWFKTPKKLAGSGFSSDSGTPYFCIGLEGKSNDQMLNLFIRKVEINQYGQPNELKDDLNQEIYYVSTTHGADAYGDFGETGYGTKLSPWKTIKYALSKARRSVSQRVRINVAGGLYCEDSLNIGSCVEIVGGYDPVTWHCDREKNRTCIANMNEMFFTRLQIGSMSILDGCIINGTLDIKNRSYVTVKNCIFANLINPCSYTNPDSSTTGIVNRFNKGIDCSSSDRITIANNIFVGYPFGIYLYDCATEETDSRRINIYNNVFTCNKEYNINSAEETLEPWSIDADDQVDTSSYVHGTGIFYNADTMVDAGDYVDIRNNVFENNQHNIVCYLRNEGDCSALESRLKMKYNVCAGANTTLFECWKEFGSGNGAEKWYELNVTEENGSHSVQVWTSDNALLIDNYTQAFEVCNDDTPTNYKMSNYCSVGGIETVLTDQQEKSIFTSEIPVLNGDGIEGVYPEDHDEAGDEIPGEDGGYLLGCMSYTWAFPINNFNTLGSDQNGFFNSCDAGDPDDKFNDIDAISGWGNQFYVNENLTPYSFQKRNGIGIIGGPYAEFCSVKPIPIGQIAPYPGVKYAYTKFDMAYSPGTDEVALSADEDILIIRELGEIRPWLYIPQNDVEYHVGDIIADDLENGYSAVVVYVGKESDIPTWDSNNDIFIDKGADALTGQDTSYMGEGLKRKQLYCYSVYRKQHGYYSNSFYYRLTPGEGFLMYCDSEYGYESRNQNGFPEGSSSIGVRLIASNIKNSYNAYNADNEVFFSMGKDFGHPLDESGYALYYSNVPKVTESTKNTTFSWTYLGRDDLFDSADTAEVGIFGGSANKEEILSDTPLELIVEYAFFHGMWINFQLGIEPLVNVENIYSMYCSGKRMDTSLMVACLKYGGKPNKQFDSEMGIINGPIFGGTVFETKYCIARWDQFDTIVFDGHGYTGEAAILIDAFPMCDFGPVLNPIGEQNLCAKGSDIYPFNWNYDCDLVIFPGCSQLNTMVNSQPVLEIILDAQLEGWISDQTNLCYFYHSTGEKTTELENEINNMRGVDHAEDWYNAINTYQEIGSSEAQLLGYYGPFYHEYENDCIEKRLNYFIVANNYDTSNEFLYPLTEHRKMINRISWFLFNGLANYTSMNILSAEDMNFNDRREYAASKEDCGYYALIWSTGWDSGFVGGVIVDPIWAGMPYKVGNTSDAEFDIANPQCHVLFKP